MMRTSLTLRILVISFACLFGASLAAAGAGGPEDTVKAFSAGFAAKDKDAVIATLAEGGAQFTLRAQHESTPPESIQTEITAYWTVVAPVLITSTSSYVRTLDILDVRVDGDIATVWTQTHTASTPLNSTEADRNSFTEVYLVVKRADGWKIAGMADNRQTTKIQGN